MRTAGLVCGVFLMAGLAAPLLAQASVTESRWMPFCAQLLGPLEDPRECALQYDGEHHGDASDACPQPFPPVLLGQPTDGFAYPVDDPYDHYALDLPPGRLVTVEVQPAPGVPVPGSPGVWVAPEYDLAVFGPGCAFLLGQSAQPGRDVVQFTAPVPGVYTLQVRAGPLAFGLVPGAGAAPGPGPGAQVCHATCFGQGVNPVLGYGLTAH